MTAPDKLALASRAEQAGGPDRVCRACDGRGWLGACTGGQFAFIGRLALAGRLPTRDCSKCAGTGRALASTEDRTP